MTVQLATQIDLRAKRALDKLSKRTHVSIRGLTEQAIFLLDEYYNRLGQVYHHGVVDKAFMDIVKSVFKEHDKTMRKLAE